MDKSNDNLRQSSPRRNAIASRSRRNRLTSAYLNEKMINYPCCHVRLTQNRLFFDKRHKWWTKNITRKEEELGP